MALDLKNLSFSRQILPLIAIVGLLAAVAFILAGLPDRELSEPGREPPRAPEQLAAEARVAGSGVVEPSSETIQIGSALSGLITGLYVQPGDRVGEGDLLFTVDDRAVRAQLREAEAAIAERIVSAPVNLWRRRRSAFQIGDQRLHLRDFQCLGLDDAVRQRPDARIRDIRTGGCQDRNRVMRNHRLHPGGVVDRCLTANQKQAEGKCQN